MFVGSLEPYEPTNRHLLPRFPISMERDIPLLLVRGYMLGGRAEPVEEHVEYFRTNGVLRSKPLTPPDDPLSILDGLMNSLQTIYKDLESNEDYFMKGENSMLMEQLLRLVDSVYRPPTGSDGYRLWDFLGKDQAENWKKCVSGVSLLKIRWDPQQNLYVWKDGGRLPPVPIKQYRRAIWKLEGLGMEAGLILERCNQTSVSYILEFSQTKGATLKPATLILYDNQSRSKPLETFNFTNSVGNGTYTSIGKMLTLKEGDDASAQLIFEGATNFSPVLKP